MTFSGLLPSIGVREAMGMDVYGRNPTAEDGEYFRASIWTWTAIQGLINELCSDLIDDETIRLLDYNVGAGPKDQKTCDRMAERFEQWMEHHVAGLIVETGETPFEQLEKKTGMAFARNEETLAALGDESLYKIDDERLKSWIRFLNCCGGFHVC